MLLPPGPRPHRRDDPRYRRLEWRIGQPRQAIGPNDPQNPTPDLTLTTHGPAVKGKLVLSDEAWKKRLTSDQYNVMRKEGTEAAFCSPLLDIHQAGVFSCAACGNPLFRTDAKFDSHTGWPSFFQPAFKSTVWYRLDSSFGDSRTEVIYSRCDRHWNTSSTMGSPTKEAAAIA